MLLIRIEATGASHHDPTPLYVSTSEDREEGTSPLIRIEPVGQPRLDETPQHLVSNRRSVPREPGSVDPSPCLCIEATIPSRGDETPLYHYTVVAPSGRTRSPALRFGDWLVRRGLISHADLFDALHDAFRCAARVGDVLVRRGRLDRGQVEEEARAFDIFTAFQRAG
jgi:hypothetical protein